MDLRREWLLAVNTDVVLATRAIYQDPLVSYLSLKPFNQHNLPAPGLLGPANEVSPPDNRDPRDFGNLWSVYY